MRNFMSKRSPSTVVPGLAIAFLLLAPATSRAEEGAAPAASSVEIWKALYAEVEAAVADGRLPPSTGAAAEELRFGLQTELIRSDAAIEILKLEAARYAGAEQQEALERLVRAAAARERLVMTRIRRLEELTGMQADLSAAPAEAAAAGLPEAEEAVAEKATNEGEEEREKRGFQLVFEAEDLVDNPDS